MGNKEQEYCRVYLTPSTFKKLNYIKAVEGLKSFEEAVRMLIKKSGFIKKDYGSDVMR